eukprot:SAG31_NODE_7202_length_1756_cov_2.165963_1_plen_190_part_00
MVFVVSPENYPQKSRRYEFKHPDENKQEQTAPFFGIWFCGGFGSVKQSAIAAIEKAIGKRVAASKTQRPAVLSSLSELREHAIVASEQELKQRLLTNPKQRALRDAALAKKDLERKQQPGFRAQKNKKVAAARDSVVVRYTDSGAQLTEEIKARVMADKKICRHFFGLGAKGDLGCNMPYKCRFKHSIS